MGIRRILPVALAMAIAVAACTTQRPTATATPASAATPALGHHVPTYFGFVGIRCGVDDPYDSGTTTDYTAEVQRFTNLVHVCVFANDVRPQLRDLPRRKLKAMLDVGPVLFGSAPGAAPSGATQRLILRPDARRTWRTFVRTNRSVLDPRHVGALYLVDEPRWNGLSKAKLKRAARLVHASLPRLPIAVIEAQPALKIAAFPQPISWVGFDSYYLRDPATDPGFAADLARLRSREHPGQREVLVLDAMWSPVHEAVGLVPADMGRVASSLQLLASRRPRVVAIVGYTWPGGVEPDQQGARELPGSVHRVYRQIGRWVRTGPH